MNAELTMITKALRQQDRLNCELSPSWAKKGWAYHRAVWTEMAEAIMHTNWPWWKANRFNMSLTTDQNIALRGEFADILHFMMSATMIDRGLRDDDLERIATSMLSDWSLSEDYRDADPYPESLSKCMEEVVGSAADRGTMNYVAFFAACRMTLLDLPTLFGLYFGKVALNKFRWSHGYKEGTYVKNWRRGGTMVEDNAYLHGFIEQALRGVDNSSETVSTKRFQDNVLAMLEAGYKEHAL